MSHKRAKSTRKRKLSRFKTYTEILQTSDSEFDEEITDPVELFEKIVEQKEIIASVKRKPWRMKNKIKVLKKAKAFVEKFEGQLSKSKGYSEAGKEAWRKAMNHYNAIKTILTPWDNRIKTVESYFGTSVASYFVFLRWIAYINCIIGVMCFAFLVTPEMLVGNKDSPHKVMSLREERHAWDLDTIWAFGGYLEHSVLFYGYYSSDKILGNGYRLPLAYFLVGLATFAYSFIALLQKMAANNKLQGSAGSEDDFIFSFKVFCSWDYMIGNLETSQNKSAAITTAIREAIVEEQEKEKEEDTRKKLRLFLRILANVLVMLLLGGSLFSIQYVVQKAQTQQGESVQEKSFYEQNEVSIIVTLITLIAPSLFEVIAQMEQYHPRNTLRLQLGRILMLYLGNLYSLMIALLQYVSEATANVHHKGKRSIDIVVDFPDLSQYMVAHTVPEIIHESTTQLATTVAETTMAETTQVATTTAPVSQHSECWETFVGQELMRLTIIDLISTVITILIIDFIRALIVKILNPCCCWDLENKFPEYGEFKIAENVLHLIYNQGITWIGCFFCPLLPLINVGKLTILMYLRSNNFYIGMLLFMLFLSLLPIMFVLARLPPSNCGPFQYKANMYTVVVETLEDDMPSWFGNAITYATTPALIFPVILLLIMIIYYLQALASTTKESNNKLKLQLQYERKEGRKNIFKIGAGKSRNNMNTIGIEECTEVKRLSAYSSISNQNSISSATKPLAKLSSVNEKSNYLQMPESTRKKPTSRRFSEFRNDSRETMSVISKHTNRSKWQNRSDDVSDGTDSEVPRYFERCLMGQSTGTRGYECASSPTSSCSRVKQLNSLNHYQSLPRQASNFIGMHQNYSPHHSRCNCHMYPNQISQGLLYVEYNPLTGTIGSVVGKSPQHQQQYYPTNAPMNCGVGNHMGCCSGVPDSTWPYHGTRQGEQNCAQAARTVQADVKPCHEQEFRKNLQNNDNSENDDYQESISMNELNTKNSNPTTRENSLNSSDGAPRKMSTLSADRKLKRSNNMDESTSPLKD